MRIFAKRLQAFELASTKSYLNLVVAKRTGVTNTECVNKVIIIHNEILQDMSGIGSSLSMSMFAIFDRMHWRAASIVNC